MITFIQTIFGDSITDTRRLALFTLPGNRTRHFSSSTSAALWASKQAETKDVYFGVGLAGRNFGKRNSSTDITCLGGLWIDLDFVAPHRSDKPLPRGIDEARSLLAKLPFAPSLVVDSGHGVHAYWLFKEPWILESEDERQKAAKLAKGWHGHVCTVAEGFGWKIENLGDLARVLRPPGTFNRKGPEPVEVRVIEEHPERRFNPDDFEQYEPAESQPDEVAVGDVVLRVDAQPPADKFAQLMATTPAFAQTWNRKRTDLQDQSQSAYDQSLANIAALQSWSDQEIANLLIAARCKHGEKPEKALRGDYIASTISNARSFAGEQSTSDVDLSPFMPPATQGPRSLKDLVAHHPALRPPVIDGLLREGETMNVIAQSKTGKSWMVIDLALSIATGRSWLGMPCVPGEVLILDNELHSETSAHRIPKVAAARGIDMGHIEDRIHIDNLRGRLQDLFSLGPYFRQFSPGRFKVVILDAFYRFLPMQSDENDNGTMASLYNYLDAYADYLKCSFVLIHHTSKGNQSLKDVTDVGAGAGAQSRATDTHLVLRRHEEKDVVVLDAAVRSWPPLEPRCLRWAFPVWMEADDLDPALLKQEGKKRAVRAESPEEEPERPGWDTPTFVEAFVRAQAKSISRILEEAEQAGVSMRRAKRFLEIGEEEGSIHRWDMGQKRVSYSTQPQPVEAQPEVIPSKWRAVVDLLSNEPNLSSVEIAERCVVSDRYVRQIRRQMEGDTDAT